MVQDRLLNGIGKDPEFLEQPLWSSYMLNAGKDMPLLAELQNLNRLLNSKYGKQLDLQPIEAFGKYVHVFVPQIEGLKYFYESLDSLKFIRENNKHLEPVINEEEAKDSLEKKGKKYTS